LKLPAATLTADEIFAFVKFKLARPSQEVCARATAGKRTAATKSTKHDASATRRITDSSPRND
jgi:hypothetical protein